MNIFIQKKTHNFCTNRDITKISKSQIHVCFWLPGPCAIHLFLFFVLSVLFSSFLRQCLKWAWLASNSLHGEDKQELHLSSAGKTGKEPSQMLHSLLVLEARACCMPCRPSNNWTTSALFASQSCHLWSLEFQLFLKKYKKEIRDNPLFLLLHLAVITLRLNFV